MLVVLDGARGVPEPIELPARLDSCAEVWPLRIAVEREIAQHGQDIVILAEACQHMSAVVLGWWVRVGEALADSGRRLRFEGLRPELEQALDLLRGPLLDANEVPKTAADRRLPKAKLPR